MRAFLTRLARAGVFILLVARAGASESPATSGPTALTPLAWEQLSNTEVGPVGAHVLALQPSKWRHAETPAYILHFRRETEARKVDRELRHNLQFVARLLARPLPAIARKPHAFIFEDAEDWNAFLTVSGAPAWSGSLAIGQDLFLNVRGGSGRNRFDYGALAHEATHAVVARLYPGRPWPVWLNEGFAEYVSGAGVADRRNQTPGRHQEALPRATLTFAELERIAAYPSDPDAIHRLYESAERVVRFLFAEFPPERFPWFVDTLLDGLGFEAAMWRIYGDRFKDWDSLQRHYRQFDP
jgi:hypothetical protein